MGRYSNPEIRREISSLHREREQLRRGLRGGSVRV
jgi:hypothetical protein